MTNRNLIGKCIWYVSDGTINVTGSESHWRDIGTDPKILIDEIKMPDAKTVYCQQWQKVGRTVKPVTIRSYDVENLEV